MNKIAVLCTGCVFSLFAGCTAIPKNAVAVSNLDKSKYLGKWYEIARFDFKFEKNLSDTSAEYTLLNNGKIGVKNRGYDSVKKVWKEAIGKAKFRGADTVGELSVSFFGPFYSGYNIIALDSDYKYALIAGNSLKYLWILSREKTIPDSIKTEYLEKANALGYDTSKLLWITHEN
jgi:apolipoprotein D and lipocalin family protein